jgi:ABC-type sulfate transport system substrate-binding protein
MKTYTPVNHKATTEARQLLEFLYSLSGQRTMTGQHIYAPRNVAVQR